MPVIETIYHWLICPAASPIFTQKLHLPFYGLNMKRKIICTNNDL